MKNQINKYQTFFNHIADPVLIFDKKTHKFLDCNKAVERVYGYTKEEIRSMTPYDLHPKEEIEKVKKRIDIRNIEEGFQYTHVTKVGRQMVVEIHSDEINYNGQPAWISVIRDITKRDLLEKQLKDFAYIVSHDLKAPLRAVNQLATWLLEDYSHNFDDEGKKLLNLLINRVIRMDNLINGILQYSRASRSRQKKKNINLNKLLTKIINSIGVLDNFQISIHENLPVIYAETTKIEQIFQNLLNNSIKYMDKSKGRIEIGYLDKGNYWVFFVKDNGPGIDKRYHKKIFQIFQTLEPRDSIESTGVGLSVVKKIIEFLDEQIWLESQLGEGSTFYFTFRKNSKQNG
ncbi:MAG: ATP-binding protein [Candidatus Aminicenantaceae bacterium]